MVLCGIVGSTVVGIIQGRRTRLVPGSRAAFIGSRLGIFYAVLYGFIILWLIIFPFVSTAGRTRYFNGHYVSQPVRTRLAKIIAELGYTRSATARNLSLGLKGCFGVVVDSTDDPWFTQLLMGIEEELAGRDTSLTLASLELRGVYDPGIVFRWIRDQRVDGLILGEIAEAGPASGGCGDRGESADGDGGAVRVPGRCSGAALR